MGRVMDTHQFAAFAGVVVPRLPRNLDPELVQRWINAPATLEDVLARALTTFPEAAPPVDTNAWVSELDLSTVRRRVFEVVIDPTQTIEQGVVAGAYDYAHPDHTTAMFGSCRKITGIEPVKAKVVAFRIGCNATCQQAKLVRTRIGNLNPICIQHELALGAQHPTAPRELRCIVNIDDVVLVGGYCYESHLYGDPVESGLDLRGAGDEWRGGAWFLGLLSES